MIILSSETISKIRAVDGCETEDPFVILYSVGLDPKTFFDYGDWNGLDFSPYDMSSVEFFRAYVTNCIFAKGDISDDKIKSCRLFSGNRFVERCVVPGERSTNINVEHVGDRVAQRKLQATAHSLRSRILDDLRSEEFPNVDLTGADLSGEDLGRINLRGAKLVGAELFGTNLVDGILVEADLESACVFGANLTRANFTRANLKSANFGAACLFAANLRYANLQETSLLQADLLQACFIGADLTGADLTGADLTMADLTGADLTNTDLSGNYFIRKCLGLCNARHLNRARLPDGWSVKWKKRQKKWDITTPEGLYIGR